MRSAERVCPPHQATSAGGRVAQKLNVTSPYVYSALRRSHEDRSSGNSSEVAEIRHGKIERDVIAHRVFNWVSDLKRELMRHIRQYNKAPRTVNRKYADPSRHISTESVVTGHWYAFPAEHPQQTQIPPDWREAADHLGFESNSSIRLSKRVAVQRTAEKDCQSAGQPAQVTL